MGALISPKRIPLSCQYDGLAPILSNMGNTGRTQTLRSTWSAPRSSSAPARSPPGRPAPTTPARARAAWMTSRADELTAAGRRFRIAWVEHLLRVGPDGPEDSGLRTPACSLRSWSRTSRAPDRTRTRTRHR